MTDRNPIIVIDRETGESFEEKILGEKWIRWAYQDSSTGFLEALLFRSSWFSRLMGLYYDSPFSKGKITPVINELGIDEADFSEPKASFPSFNAFFARTLKPEARPFNRDPDVLVSPADGRVLVFPCLDAYSYAPVKGYPFTIQQLLPDHAKRFKNGALATIRLCPADYHRYHFPCAGTIVEYGSIPGHLHSVNPIALGRGLDVFGTNKRNYTLIDTSHFGPMCFIEVGAFGVGSINNTRQSGPVEKMNEKGYFKFGGSTVVLLFEAGRVRFAEDLIRNSTSNRETLIKVGQDLATVIRD